LPCDTHPIDAGARPCGLQFQQHAVAQFIGQQRLIRQQRFVWKFIAVPAIWRVLGWQFIAVFILQRVLRWQFIAIAFFQWVNGPKRQPAVGWANAVRGPILGLARCGWIFRNAGRKYAGCGFDGRQRRRGDV
jgi:hypothetical protein